MKELVMRGVISMVVFCALYFLLPLLLQLLAPGEKRHFEPGENSQFRPDENSQSVPKWCSQPRSGCRF